MRRAIVVVATAVAMVGASQAQSPRAAASAPTVREGLMAPLQAAQSLIAAKKFDEALAQVRLAEAVADRSPYETYIVERLRAVAAGGLGDAPTAQRGLEAALQTGQGSAEDRLALMAAAANAAYGLKDHERTVRWAREHVDQGGRSETVQLLLGQSQYLLAAYPAAIEALNRLWASQQAAGRAPSRKQLELHASAFLKAGDEAGYARMLEALLKDRPTPQVWADRLARLSQQPGFDARLLIDVLRLGVAAMAWPDATQYVQLAERALQSGYAFEARRVLDAGETAGLVGQGPDAPAHRVLRQQITRQIEADQRSPLPTDAKAMAGKDGLVVFRTGYDLYMAGRIDEGLALMESARQRGIAPRPEDALLRLATAYAGSGQPAHLARAREIFTGLSAASGTDGLSDLARLWLMQLPG